jgi:hypothetical protein
VFLLDLGSVSDLLPKDAEWVRKSFEKMKERSCTHKKLRRRRRRLPREMQCQERNDDYQ